MTHYPIGATSRAWLDGAAHRDELAPHTIANYGRFLASFADHVGPDTDITTITPEHIEAWLAGMVDPFGAPLMGSTRRTRLTATRSFFHWAVERNLIQRDPARLVRSPRTRKGPPKRARGDDLAKVLAVAEPRARVMMIVALQTFIRRTELAGLQVEDWDGDRLYIRHGKGGKERWVAVPDEARRELAAWVAVLGRSYGPMWPSSHRPGEGLTPGSISHIVNRAGQRAGVKLWTHLLRHTGISDAVAAGAPISAVQRQAGHSSSSVTDHYIHMRDVEVRTAVEGRRYRGQWAGLIDGGGLTAAPAAVTR